MCKGHRAKRKQSQCSWGNKINKLFIEKYQNKVLCFSTETDGLLTTPIIIIISYSEKLYKKNASMHSRYSYMCIIPNNRFSVVLISLQIRSSQLCTSETHRAAGCRRQTPTHSWRWRRRGRHLRVSSSLPRIPRAPAVAGFPRQVSTGLGKLL